MGGSSKKVTVGYKYYLGMHMVLCHGPIDSITEIHVDKRLAWQGNETGGTLSIDNEGLFGGEDREGGISGDVDILMGGPSQTKNSYLQARLGTNIPAFRGVVSAVLKQVYLGLNPYLKAWAFRGTRIYVTSEGEEQWYPDKARIANPVVGVLLNEQFSSLSSYTTYEGSSSAFSIVSDDYGNALNIAAGVSTNDSIQRQFAQEASVYSVRGKFKVLSSGTDDSGVIRLQDDSNNQVFFFNPRRAVAQDASRRPHFATTGTSQQFTTPGGALDLDHWYQLEASYNSFSDNWVFSVYDLDDDSLIHSQTIAGTPSGTASNLRWAIQNDGVNGSPTRWADVQITSGFADMNPIHILRECLTDKTWGMGYLSADIDDTSFTTAANTLVDEKMGMSLLWDRQIPIEDFVGEVLRHINAVLFVDRISGKFVVKLIRDDYDVDDLITLDETNILTVSDYSRVDQGDAVNSVTVIYWDSAKGENAGITADDIAMIQAYGTVVNTTIQYPGFTNSFIAGKAAQRDLKSLSSPLLSCTIEANREASNLNIGDVFKFQYSDYHDGYIVMRVHQIALGDGKNNRVKIVASEDVFALPTTSVLAEEDPGWVEPGGEPVEATDRLVVEAPYYEMVQSLGQTDIDNQISTTPEIGYLIAAAARPTNGLNAKVWVDDGSGYEESAVLDFSPSLELATTVDRNSTTWDFINGQDLDQVIIGTHGQIGNELIRIDSIDEGTGEITVGRGVLDTVPEPHTSGDILIFWDVYAASDNTEYVDAEEIDVKILPNTNQGGLALADATADALIFDSRAVRPYPPGKLQFNSEYFPDAIVGTLTLDWAHRDRLQQTSGSLYDFLDNSIGPEASTTYNLYLYDEDNTLAETVTGLTGTTYTWSSEVSFSTIGIKTPTLHYAMNDDSGGTLVDEQATQNGTITGATLVSGGIKNSNCLDFDGSSDHCNVSYAITITSYLGVSLWIDPDHDASDGRMVGWRDVGTPNIILRVVNGDVYWSVRSSSAASSVSCNSTGSAVATSVSGWTHVFAEAIRSGTNVTVNLYLNGSLVATNSDTGQSGNFNISNLNIGESYIGGLRYNGLMDQIRIYDDTTALSASEITALANENTPAGLNSSVRAVVESQRDGYTSYQQHDYTVDRAGYGLQYGKYYGGI